jgi:hypothetical protein
MRSILLVAATAAILTYAGNAHAQPGKPGYESAVCACRSYGGGPDKWAACMKSKGHNVAPGSGYGVACRGGSRR